MKSLKKTLVLLVVFSMILSTLVPAFAFDDVVGEDCEEQVTRMVALGILDGMGDGTFQPEGTITRAQMAKIICYMTGVDESLAETSKNTPSKFDDVATGAWYTGYVNIASNNGIINGYPDGKFRPEQELTMNEVLTLCVKALGRGGYVEKTGGTWPANYIAEAARLNLLKDVENQAVANRGNVAIISWNTLNSKEWTRTGEEINGVNFGDGEEVKTLLAIHFSEFTTESDELKEIKNLKVTSSPARDINLGDRQIVLASAYDVDFDFETNPKKSERKEITYAKGTTTTSDVVAYVPEEVYEDLDSLVGKEVTVLFGDDNEVALIVVEDDSVENAYVEEYDDAKEEITIAGEDYEFSNDVTVEIYVNNNKMTGSVATAMTNILNEIDEDANEDFTKKVEASVVLDEDGDIARLDLYVSGTYDLFNTIEGVVTKNSSDVITYYYYNGSNWTKGTYDYEDELNDDKLPRVTIDGEKASVEDIEAGNVITMIHADGNDEDVRSIYAVTAPVAGEVTRTKNEGSKISVDGTEYVASMGVVLATDNEIKDAGKTVVTLGDTIAKNDEVTLYVNIYGEYVIVITDDAGDSAWEFAYVRSIKEVDENDAEEYVATLRLLLADGTKTSTYSIVVDSEDFDSYDAATPNIDEFENAIVAKYIGKVIAFKANAENEIVFDDIKIEAGSDVNDKTDDVITLDVDLVEVPTTGSTFDIGNDYEVVYVQNNISVDDDREMIGTYDFTANTKIFEVAEEKVYTKWGSIIANGTPDKLAVANSTDVAVVLDGNKIAYMVFGDVTATSSDEVFAIYKDVDSDEITLFDGENNVMEHTGATIEAKAETFATNSFVEYTVNGANEVEGINYLVDVDAFRDEDATTAVLGEGTTKLVEKIKNLKTNNVKVTATVSAGAYKTAKDGAVTLYPTGEDEFLYAYLFEDAGLTVGDPYTFVFNNPALVTADLDDDGLLVKYDADIDDKKIAILLEHGKTSIVSVYEGDVQSTYETEIPVAVYNFNDVKITEADTTTYTGNATTAVSFEKEIFAVESTGSLKFTYADGFGDEHGIDSLGTIKVDKETVVYDLREEVGFATLTFSEFVDLAGTETLYVVPFANGTPKDGADANILVIVE